MYVKKGHALKPFLIGGEQEKGLRAGTENIHNILGMEKALDIALSNLEEEQNYIQNLKYYRLLIFYRHKLNHLNSYLFD